MSMIERNIGFTMLRPDKTKKSHEKSMYIHENVGMRIGIGVDTGGTYTDAVALDLDSNTLLAKGKSLTTRENLSIGIGNALDHIPPELISGAKLISLSTTLATNACVENKGCRAKLIIFGLTDELIERYDAGAEYGFKQENVRCIDTKSSADGLFVDEPVWDAVFAELHQWISDADAMSIAELYSASNGAPNEKKAKKLIEERYGIECVGASELSRELNVIARGATALLNARLLPIGREFIEAAMSDFRKRGCDAPIMIVRSDGSLMSAEFTRERPVETILSGPAASVLAGKGITEKEDYLIVDIGGTTTDVSVVRQGIPAKAGDGIKIGGWRTHVKGVYIDTFAFGGDSRICMANNKLQIMPRRAMPVCVAASHWSEIKTALIELLNVKRTNQFPLHEFLYLVREPEDLSRYLEYEQELIELLKKGPRALGGFTKSVGIDLYRLDSERLEAEGVIMRCGLTPTDFMHIKGDYVEYDAEASELAARFLLMTLGREDTQENLNALVDEVYDKAEGLLYENLIRILLEHEHSAVFTDGLDDGTLCLIRDTWSKRNGAGSGFFSQSFKTDAALVGIGAPTRVFLPSVAMQLGAECILPEHAEVANAIGALKAGVNPAAKVEISQTLSASGGFYYIVHAPNGSRKFRDLGEAIELAKSAAEEAVVKEARLRGADGELSITTSVQRHTTVTEGGAEVALGCTVTSEVTVSNEGHL